MTQENSLISAARELVKNADAKMRPGLEKEFTDALLAQMAKDGIIAACVPTQFDGPGLGIADLARIGFFISRADGSAGLVYAMHMSQALSVVHHGKGAYFEEFQRRMVAEQILIASGTSEKGPGGDILTSIATIEDAPGGKLTVTKESPNISYVDHAGAILISANKLNEKGKAQQVLFVGEKSTTEFTPGFDVSLLGMKGMLNRPWSFTSTFAPETIFPELFPTIARTTMTPTIQILWAAHWSGIAAGALEKAKTFVSKELPREAEVTPVVQHQLTRLVDKHYMMNAIIRDAIAEYEDRDAGGEALGFGLSARINRLKVCASELVNEICQGALDIIGIRAYATGGPYTLAASLADALSGPIMVSNVRLSMNNAKIENFVAEEL